jgi:hypothetical protein
LIALSGSFEVVVQDGLVKNYPINQMWDCLYQLGFERIAKFSSGVLFSLASDVLKKLIISGF